MEGKIKMLSPKELIQMNEFIHKDYENLEYHMAHIKLANKYALMINERLGKPVDDEKLTICALSHDLLKEHGLKPGNIVDYSGIVIPQDTTDYVRRNLEVLEDYGMDDYFSSDASYHALAAAIFMRKELDISDPHLLWPVMFHSCPIISVYEELIPEIKTEIDIIALADKLSSNMLKINMLDKKAKCDLDMIVFGESGNEFSYTLGLYIARLIATDKSCGHQGRIANTYYHSRLCTNSLIVNNIKLEGKELWPKRKQRYQMLLQNL